jgi:hypothetical protein
MATEQERDRWLKTLQNILTLYDNKPSPVRMMVERGMSFPHAQAVSAMIAVFGGSLVEAWESEPPTSDLRGCIESAYQSAKRLDPQNNDSAQLGAYISTLRTAIECVGVNVSDTHTPEEVLADLALDAKLAVLSARLGHQGIMRKIDERLQETSRGVTRGAVPGHRYLDLQTMQATSEPSNRTVGYTDLQSVIDPGYATTEEYVRGYDESDQPTVLKYFAAQWVIYITTQWDELYRDQLAVAHGVSKNDVRSELFADLAKLRQDYVHNRGKASRKNSARATKLTWFAEGDEMIPTHADYDQFYRELELEAASLVRRPEPIEENRVNIGGTVPAELRLRFDQAADAAGLRASEALEAALTAWVESGE